MTPRDLASFREREARTFSSISAPSEGPASSRSPKGTKWNSKSCRDRKDRRQPTSRRSVKKAPEEKAPPGGAFFVRGHHEVAFPQAAYELLPVTFRTARLHEPGGARWLRSGRAHLPSAS